MSGGRGKKDLVILAADKSIETAIRALLNRPESLGIRKISFDIFVHSHRDPGVLNEAGIFLAPFSKLYDYALAAFDREGCGSNEDAVTLAGRVEIDIARHGWGTRVKAIVLDPELEAWVWSDSTHVPNVLGWENISTKDMLAELGYLPESGIKPARPKEAMKAALWRKKIPRSSSLYGQIASKVSLKNCQDPAFICFKTIMYEWFSSSK